MSFTKKNSLSEAAFEDGVMEVLAASPLYAARDASHFDAATLLDTEQLWDFIEATQPKELAKLHKQFPDAPREALAAHVTGLIQKRGTLEVLRNGVSFSGINLQLAFFRPSAGGNQEHQARYEGNRFAVMRQVHFSTKTPDQSADVVILLNSLPIVSVELKNHFTNQNVQHAIAQYRRRDKNEPFWKRCLVHFAVDDDAAYMCTQIAGADIMRLAAMSAAKQCPCVPSLIYSRYWTSTRSWLRSWFESAAHRANTQGGQRNDTRTISIPARYGKP